MDTKLSSSATAESPGMWKTHLVWEDCQFQTVSVLIRLTIFGPHVYILYLPKKVIAQSYRCPLIMSTIVELITAYQLSSV